MSKRQPNLILYESFIDIFFEYIEDEEPELAFEYITAIFNYHRNGEIYDGKSKDVKRQMKNIYPLINKRVENYNDQVDSSISDEEFIELAQSGNFKTQQALADFITENYNTNYTQQAVSKRLKALQISLVKTKNCTTGCTKDVQSGNKLLQIQHNTTTDKEKEIEIETDTEGEQVTTSFQTKGERMKSLMSGLM